MLEIREFAPRPELEGVVLRAADFHERGEPVRRREGPMLGVVVIVSLGPDIEIDGQPIGSFTAGLWDRPVTTGHFGEQHGYQLNLDLVGARRLLGVPLGELANRLVRLEDVLGSRAGELAERLGDASSAAGRDEVAQAAVAAGTRDDQGVAPQVAYVLRRLQATRGTARVESLAAEVGWSRRHLSARFREEIGLAPKVVARLARAEHAVERLRAGEGIADAAFAAGYADQPHFNREFRALVGCTPSEFPFVQDVPVAA